MTGLGYLSSYQSEFKLDTRPEGQPPLTTMLWQLAFMLAVH